MTPAEETQQAMLESIAKLNETLDAQDVPTEGRYIHCHPWMAEAALAAGILVKTDEPNVFAVNPEAFK